MHDAMLVRIAQPFGHLRADGNRCATGSVRPSPIIVRSSTPSMNSIAM